MVTRWITADQAPIVRRCRACGGFFYPRRSDHRTCSDACRRRASRANRAKCDSIRDSPRSEPATSGGGESGGHRVLNLHPVRTVDLCSANVAAVELPPDLADQLRDPATGQLSGRLPVALLPEQDPPA